MIKEYKNKKINFEYTIHTTYMAGIQLEGWEVSALKNSASTNINGTYCNFNGKNFAILNMNISPTKNSLTQDKSIENKQDRPKNLLLNKSELNKIQKALEVKGFTCVPTKLVYMENRWKLFIAIVSGKNNYDKRNSLKEKDIKRDIERTIN